MGRGAESTVCGLGMPGLGWSAWVFSDRVFLLLSRAGSESGKDPFTVKTGGNRSKIDLDGFRDRALSDLPQKPVSDSGSATSGHPV